MSSFLATTTGFSGATTIALAVVVLLGVQAVGLILFHLARRRYGAQAVIDAGSPRTIELTHDERLFAALGASPLPMLVLDTEAGQFARVNHAARRFLGVAHGLPLDALLLRIDEDQRADAHRCIRAASQGEESASDVQLLLATDLPTPAHLRALPLDGSRQARLVLITIEGPRARAEADPSVLVVTLAEDLIEETNDAFDRALGRAPASTVGHRLEELVAADWKGAVARLLARRLSGEELARPHRIPVLGAGGDVVPVDWVFVHRFDDRGRSLLIGTGRLAFAAVAGTTREEALDAVIHATPFASLVLDPQGSVIEADPDALRLLGPDLEPGRLPAFLGAQPDRTDLEPLRELVDRALLGQEAEVELLSLPSTGPGGGYFRTITRGLRDASGDLRAVMLLIEDRTAERQAAIQAKEENRRQQRFLVDNLNQGGLAKKAPVQTEVVRFLMDNLSEMFVVVQDGRFAFSSEGSRKLLGVVPQELLGRRFADFVAREQRGRIDDILAGVVVARAVHELPMVKADGTLLWVEFRPQATTWSSREAVIGVLTDITERRDADHKLRFQATVLDQMRDWVAVIDRSGQLRYLSPALERLLGTRAGTFQGRSLQDLSDALDTDLPPVELVAVSCEEAGSWQGRAELRTADRRELQADITFSPMHDAQRRHVGFIALGHDVTAQAALEAKVLHTQKMDAIGQLAGGVAHDFNNILVAIKGYAELAYLRTEIDEETQSDLIGISEAADRASQLTRQLLTFSRQEVTQPRPVDLWEVARDFHKMLRRIVGDGVELEVATAPEGLWTTIIDPGQAELVLMNLSVNARDSMPDGGTVRVSLRNAVVDGSEARLQGRVEPGDYVLLTVSDEGTGIPEHLLARVFDPFFTTKEVGKGTGLGLSTVYGIVKQQNGGIDVESRDGEGTTFHVYLPASRLPATALRTHGAEIERGRGELILIAEDNPLVLEVAERTLRSYGYEVLTATSGAEAIDVFRERKGDIALTILDVVMPKMSGPVAWERMRAEEPGARVLFCSGYSQGELKPGLLEDQDVGFLPKPYSPSELLAHVREVLDRGKAPVVTLGGHRAAG